jgi:hypothetical protein
MIHIVMDIFEITFSMFDYLLYVIIIMLIYGIKIIQKMPIYLTLNSSEHNLLITKIKKTKLIKMKSTFSKKIYIRNPK